MKPKITKDFAEYLPGLIMAEFNIKIRTVPEIFNLTQSPPDTAGQA